MTWIETWTGRQFFALDPKKEDVCLEDIAHGLSNVCRYGGQCEFFSVAEHSVLLSRYMETLPRPGRLPLIALLHDAAEAYLGDIPRPTKKLVPDYHAVESRLLNHVYDALEVEPPTDDEQAILLDVDNRVILDERPAVKPNARNDWGAVENLTPLGIRIYKWHPRRAKEEFLNRFYELVCEVRP